MFENVRGTFGIADRGTEGDSESFIFIVIDGGHHLSTSFIVAIEQYLRSILGNVLFFDKGKTMELLGGRLGGSRDGSGDGDGALSVAPGMDSTRAVYETRTGEERSTSGTEIEWSAKGSGNTLGNNRLQKRKGKNN